MRSGPAVCGEADSSMNANQAAGNTIIALVARVDSKSEATAELI